MIVTYTWSDTMVNSMATEPLLQTNNSLLATANVTNSSINQNAHSFNSATNSSNNQIALSLASVTNCSSNQITATNKTAPPSFSEVLAEGIAPKHQKVTSYIKMVIVPPFTKEHFKNNDVFERAAKSCVSSILSSFKPVDRQKITISKTFMKMNEKRLHSMIVIAPTEAEEDLDRLKLGGLPMLGKTIFPTAEHCWRYDPTGYPKTAMLRLTEVPGLADDDDIKEELKLPKCITINSQMKRQKQQTAEGAFFTGVASVPVEIPDEKSETVLREWSFKSYLENSLEWIGVPFKAHVPSLHRCDTCEAEGKPSVGHDKAWCRIKRQSEVTVNPPQQPQVPVPETVTATATTTRNDDDDDDNPERWHIAKVGTLRRSLAFKRGNPLSSSSPETDQQTPSKHHRHQREVIPHQTDTPKT